MRTTSLATSCASLSNRQSSPTTWSGASRCGTERGRRSVIHPRGEAGGGQAAGSSGRALRVDLPELNMGDIEVLPKAAPEKAATRQADDPSNESPVIAPRMLTRG